MDDGPGWGAGILIAIGVLGLVVGISVFCWQGGWWLDKSSINHHYQNNVESQQFQGGIVTQIENDITSGYDLATVPAQKQEILNQICTEYTKLTPESVNTNPDIVAFHAAHCPA